MKNCSGKNREEGTAACMRALRQARWREGSGRTQSANEQQYGMRNGTNRRKPNHNKIVTNGSGA